MVAVRGRKPAWATHLKSAYRSGLEVAVAAALSAAGVAYGYERLRVPFKQPEKARTYTPDIDLPNGIVVELKGLFTTEDRAKHLWVKEQHPDLHIRFVFSNPTSKLSKGSKTTYADWCVKHGYLYAKKSIPNEWLTEPVDPLRVAAVAAFRKG